ncbi:MAG: hypothetical protein EBT94_06715 [Alphaproteobacteria bacterium]|jgi:hypothetical protein|nr:hypothetical protein [Alphaproteobacteria bacterium]
MAEDVIDIRKRIEDMRNEVSSALADDSDVVIPSQPAGEVAEFSVPGVTATSAAVSAAPVLAREATQPAPDLETMRRTKGALDDALQLPSFQLNVRNQGMNKVLLFLVACQLITNVCLIAIIWQKLG